MIGHQSLLAEALRLEPYKIFTYITAELYGS